MQEWMCPFVDIIARIYSEWSQSKIRLRLEEESSLSKQTGSVHEPAAGSQLIPAELLVYDVVCCRLIADLK